MISPKEKPCKGMGKAKGFEGCGKMVLKRTYGLGNCCYPKWLLNTPEGKEKLQVATIKASKPRKDLEEAIETDKKTKGIQAALQLTKQVVHGYIRERDKGKSCISCGAQWNAEFQAGHCYPTRYRSIRFNLFNINGQCVLCNIGKDGNETNYLIRLPKRIGGDNFKDLKKLAEIDSRFNKHWTKDELTNIRKEVRTKLKDL